MSETRKTARLLPYACASAAACAVAFLVARALQPEARAAATCGVLAASAGALCALVALAASMGRGVNGLLAGFTAGFLCRALLVGLGLVASSARGNLALVYVAAFFMLYAATQVVEVLFVYASSRRTSGAMP